MQAADVVKGEVFVFISGAAYVWAREYVVDAEEPLTEAQTALVDKAVTEPDQHSCASEGCDAPVGFYLAGDADEYCIFAPFWVSGTRMLCEACGSEG